jgi:transposase InsO family protein
MSVRDHVAPFPVGVMCGMPGVSRSGRYAWARRAEGPRAGAGRAPAALETARARRRPAPGLVHHAGRGARHAAHGHRAPLRRHGMIFPMSRRGDRRDNAPMESSFATLKGGLVEEAGDRTRDEARAGVFQYIEGFHNRRGLHSALGYITPEQKAAAFHSAASAA